MGVISSVSNWGKGVGRAIIGKPQAGQAVAANAAQPVGVLKKIHQHVSLNYNAQGTQISDKVLIKGARTTGGYALAAAGAVGGRQAATHLPGKVGQFLEKTLPEKMTAPVKNVILKIDPQARYVVRQAFIEASTFGGFLAPSAILRKLRP
jgi:hypothetical protein